MSNEEKNSGFNRVVITGMGAISPAGFGVDALWSKVASGECCFTLLPEEKREQLNVSVVGAIPDYDPLKAGFSKKESRRFAPFVQYAILASDEAGRHRYGTRRRHSFCVCVRIWYWRHGSFRA